MEEKDELLRKVRETIEEGKKLDAEMEKIDGKKKKPTKKDDGPALELEEWDPLLNKARKKGVEEQYGFWEDLDDGMGY